jgi:predicted 3-demethylubiquinone-9 3-methyltransferase (glyoxalase superfamily)
MQKIVPHLWFDTQVKEAAEFYVLAFGGDSNAQQCGWLKDRYGVSWQVVPRLLEEMISKGGKAQVDRVTKAW